MITKNVVNFGAVHETIDCKKTNAIVTEKGKSDG